jgi:Tol biopolymer transport system component
MLAVRELTSFNARVLPGTEDAQQPFFSPDGRSIGFFAQGKLKRVALSGGAPVVLADAVNPRGASWGAKHTIVFAPTPSSGLFEVADAGGAVRAVTTVDRQQAEGGHRWPEFLPDGTAVLFAAGPATTNTGWSEAHIALVRLDTGQRVDLVPRGTYPKYAGGVLFHVESNRLLAQAFDPGRPQASGAATTVLDDVAQGGGGGVLIAISSSGSLAYGTAAPATPQPLVWVDRTGREQALSMAAGVYTTPRLSPDGHRVAVAVSSANTDVWVYDLDRGTSTRLTFEGGNLSPAWTPDGARVAFASNRHGPSEIYWTTADGGGGAEQLTTSDEIHFPTSWSPDGRTLLVMSVNAALNTDVLVWPRGGRMQPFLQTAFAEERAVFSPDGRWVAYVLNEANRGEVFVRAFSGGDRRWQISNAGGTDPVWSRNGRELFYRQGDVMMAVDVAPGASFSAGTPRRLFSGRYAGGVVASYDVSADGHFLMVRAPAAAETREIRIAVGWVDDARRQVADANR